MTDAGRRPRREGVPRTARRPRPASRAGTRRSTVQGQQFTIGGDIITAADGQAIASADELIAFLTQKKPGDKVTLTVERDGKTQDVTVTLAERPANL